MTGKGPLEDLTEEVTRRARSALMQGLAMHDASTVLLATHEFSQWVQIHLASGAELSATDVVSFYMNYARALIDRHAGNLKAPHPDLFSGH